MPEPDPQQPSIRPLSRGASRVFVLVCLLVMFATAAGATWFLTRSALKNQERIEANTREADSTAVRGFGVTQY